MNRSDQRFFQGMFEQFSGVSDQPVMGVDQVKFDAILSQLDRFFHQIEVKL